MRGNVSAPKWLLFLALGLVVAAHLACLAPSAANRVSTTPTSPAPASSPTPQSSRALTPTSVTITARISEEDVNGWLQGQRTTLGEGVDCLGMQVRIHRDGIRLSATLEVTRLRGVTVPVEVLAVPTVRSGGLQMEVRDVQLGGAYAPMSGPLKSVLTAGLGRALEAESLLAPQGMDVSQVELEDGFIVITGTPQGR